MVGFCKDTDILKYEPELFRLMHMPSQILINGEGASLSDSVLTTTTANFVSCGAEPGGVIYLLSSDASIDGVFEIVSVDSPNQLTISILRVSEDSPVIPVGSADTVTYRICSYRPQIRQVSFNLTERFGIQPGNPASTLDSETIVNMKGLERVTAFGVISAVYASLASDIADEILWQKSYHYRDMFEKACEGCMVGLDTDGDGQAEQIRSGGSMRLRRD